MWCVGGLLSGEAAGARRRDRGTTVQHNRSTYRLTLNILLSFAQFEREVIAERTRDTIAAMRRKGKWCGGRPILGYDVALDTRGPRLVVNPAEAAQVREIFTLYLSLRSLLAIGGTTHRRPRSHCPMQSNVLSDVPEYHPFFGTSVWSKNWSDAQVQCRVAFCGPSAGRISAERKHGRKDSGWL